MLLCLGFCVLDFNGIKGYQGPSFRVDLGSIQSQGHPPVVLPGVPPSRVSLKSGKCHLDFAGKAAYHDHPASQRVIQATASATKKI